MADLGLSRERRPSPCLVRVVSQCRPAEQSADHGQSYSLAYVAGAAESKDSSAHAKNQVVDECLPYTFDDLSDPDCQNSSAD